MKISIAIAAIALAAIVATESGAAHAQAQPIRGNDGTTWWKCADEGSVCRFRDKRRVAFGANGKWRYREANQSIACTSNAFGGDPAIGVVKRCYYQSETEQRPLAAVDGSWRRCAGEGHVCQFQGERRVAFGANGRWSYRIARNGVHCSPGAFGDPALGVVKSCYIDPYY